MSGAAQHKRVALANDRMRAKGGGVGETVGAARSEDPREVSRGVVVMSLPSWMVQRFVIDEGACRKQFFLSCYMRSPDRKP